MIKQLISPQPKRQSNYIQSLDGIRGFAFILVLLAHFSNHYGLMFQGVGRIGVWLFFVLSSFLLASYFLANPEKIFSRFEWANYTLRRTMRIMPLFFFILLLYSTFNYLIEGPESLLNHLLFLEGNGHFWTIPSELKYYLVLPFVVFTMIVVFKNKIHLTLISLAIIIALYLVFLPTMLENLSIVSLLLYLPVFLSGSVLALVHMKIKKNPINPLFFNIGSLLIFSFLILTIPSVWSTLFYEVENTYFYNYNAEFGVILALFLLCILNGSKHIRKIFENRILLFFGNISYSGYLIHPIILYNVRIHLSDYLSTTFLVLISAVLILLSSILLHVLIEKPSMKVKLTKKEVIPEQAKAI